MVTLESVAYQALIGLYKMSYYWLVASGLALIFGITRVLNFAHGAIYILAGLTAWSVTKYLIDIYPIAVIIAILTAGVVGAAIYQFLAIRVRGMPVSEIILTYVISIGIIEILRFLGFIGPMYHIPMFYEGVVLVPLFNIAVDIHRVIIVLVSVALYIALWLFTHYTRVGLAFRAIAQDEQVAMMLGIDSDRMATLSFFIGSILAGLAAITVLPLGAIAPEAAYEALIIAITVCILGGLGSVIGTVIAGLILGMSRQFVAVFIGTQWQMIVLFAALIIILIVRPSGIFGVQKEVEERV
jgi:branched-chain amino acid transport system permease protein